MLSALPTLTLISLFIGSCVITIISLLYIKEHKQREKAQETQEKTSKLLSAAEMVETKKIEEHLQTKLDELFATSEQTATNAQKQLYDFLGQLKNEATQSQTESQRSVEERINEMFERLETRLSDFLIKTEQSTTSSIELELRSARNLIENYKTQQLALIDENILAMMEQTLNIVLSKKLSLKDQLDLIYEALEKAKMEKFLA